MARTGSVGRGRAPAAHHLVGGEPADPAARDALRHQALRARRPRRAPHRRRRGGAARWCASCGAGPSRPSGQLAELAGRRGHHAARGGQRLSRQGAPGAGAAATCSTTTRRCASRSSPRTRARGVRLVGERRRRPRGGDRARRRRAGSRIGTSSISRSCGWGRDAGASATPLTERLRREPAAAPRPPRPRPRAARPVSRRRAHPPGVDHRRAERVAPAVASLGRARHRAGSGTQRSPEAPTDRVVSAPRRMPCAADVALMWRATARQLPTLSRACGVAARRGRRALAPALRLARRRSPDRQQRRARRPGKPAHAVSRACMQ